MYVAQKVNISQRFAVLSMHAAWPTHFCFSSIVVLDEGKAVPVLN
jgi:hypothetical protein